MEGVAAQGFGGFACRWGGRLDSEELSLGRCPGGREGRLMLGRVQVPGAGPNDAGGGEEGENAHLTVTWRAPARVRLVDSGGEPCRATSGAAVSRLIAGGAVAPSGGLVPVSHASPRP